jgi:hypothetical protein
LSVFAIASLPAKADFNPIALPTAGYTSSTSLINIAGIPDGTTGIPSVTDGTQIVSFGVPMNKTTVGVNFATWGAPPFTESSTPPVLTTPPTTFVVTTLQLQLSVPSLTFGFELQGDALTTNEFNVQFYEGAVPVGNITLFIDGTAGARLFAASSTDSPFTSVVINNVDGRAGGFAIANLRYTAVPEPASIAMVAQAIAVVGFYGWRKRRQAAAKV